MAEDEVDGKRQSSSHEGVLSMADGGGLHVPTWR